MEDVVERILNNEVVVFADLQDLQRVQTLATQTPFIIDKLEAYRNDLECDLLTYLGIDNNNIEKKERLIVDEVNANNDAINSYGAAIESEIQKFLDDINRVFGRKITITPRVKPVNTTQEAIRGQDSMEKKPEEEPAKKAEEDE